MKKVVMKSMLLLIIAIFGSAMFLSLKAQSKAAPVKVYAVINRADWCPVCRGNETRVMKEVMPAFKNTAVKFVTNDLTNDQTIANSTVALKKNKVFDAVKETQSTGVILMVNAHTKKLIKEISISEPSEQIIKEITAARG